MQLLVGVAFACVLVALVLAIFLVPIPAIQGAIVGGLVGFISAHGSLLVQRYLEEGS